MKKFVQLIVVLSVIGLAFIASGPAMADPPDEAGGEWSYYVHTVDARVAGGNTFMTMYSDDFWTGTFVGESTSVGMVAIHPSGKTSYAGTVTFVGEVDGRSGTFEMSAVGQCCDEQGWDGQWVILSGTGGLADLRGQGTWFGPGAGGPYVWGSVGYEGKYHFEPGE